MHIIKKYQYSGQINPVTIEDYLNYWRDNNVETDEALIERLADTYGKDHMLKWILQRQNEKNNPYTVYTGTGTVTPAVNKSLSTRVADRIEDVLNSNTLPGGLARTVGVATLGGAALTHLPATLGGIMGGSLLNTATGGFGEKLENLTGLDPRIGDMLNPGYMVGGGAGDLAWNAGKFIYALRGVTKDMPEGFMGVTHGRGKVIKDLKHRFKKKLGNGAEGTVYSDGEGHAYKINENLFSNRQQSENLITLMDRLEEIEARGNTGLPFIFPTELRGYVFDLKTGKINPVTRQQQLQPYQMLEYHPRIGSYESIQAMKKAAAAKGLLIADLHKGNIAVLDDGTFVVIDPIISSAAGDDIVAHTALPSEKYVSKVVSKPYEVLNEIDYYKYRLQRMFSNLKYDWNGLMSNIRKRINK